MLGALDVAMRSDWRCSGILNEDGSIGNLSRALRNARGEKEIRGLIYANRCLAYTAPRASGDPAREPDRRTCSATAPRSYDSLCIHTNDPESGGQR